MVDAREWAGAHRLLRSNLLLGHPEICGCKRFGVFALSLGEKPGCLSAAGNAEFASCLAKAVVDRVNRKTEISCDRLGIMSRQQQPQRVLFPFTQRF